MQMFLTCIYSLQFNYNILHITSILIKQNKKHACTEKTTYNLKSMLYFHQLLIVFWWFVLEYH